MTGAEADGGDALRGALAGVLIREYGACDDGEEAQAWLAAEHLMPLMLAYGREQATRGAEQALRDAADEWPGTRVAVTGTVHGWLRTRADDLGRQV